jgi:hypothetical protein
MSSPNDNTSPHARASYLIQAAHRRQLSSGSWQQHLLPQNRGTMMDKTKKPWKQSILRALIISASGILFGFVLYGNAVFISTLVPVQFTVSSITAGIVYAALKSQSPRIVWAMLLIWYALLTGREALHNSWLFILYFTYIVGITVAIFAYNHIVTKPAVNRVVLRPIFAAAIIAIVNGLIIILLELIQYIVYGIHFRIRLDIVNLNTQFGAIIGIAIGTGIEIAEYLIRKLSEDEEEIMIEDLTQHKVG